MVQKEPFMSWKAGSAISLPVAYSGTAILYEENLVACNRLVARNMQTI